jgi:hypothetical protein
MPPGNILHVQGYIPPALFRHINEELVRISKSGKPGNP